MKVSVAERDAAARTRDRHQRHGVAHMAARRRRGADAMSAMPDAHRVAAIRGQAPDRRRALSVAARVLPGAVPDRPQDQPVADRDRAAALYAGARPRRRPRRACATSSPACRSTITHARSPTRSISSSYLKSLQVAAVSTADAGADRLSDRLRRSRARRGGAQPLLVILVMLPFWTVVPDPRLCLDQHPAARRAAQPGAALALGIVDEPPAWLATDTAIYIGIVYSYLPFMVLPLYAALETHGRDAARGGGRSRLPAVEVVLARHAAAVAARRRRRRAALLHSDRRRVRDSRPARRLGDPDDRADACGPSSSPTATGRSRPRSRSCC